MTERDNNGQQQHQTDYEVGYGKPPAASRFKPGQSGNRKGRPKRKEPTMDEIDGRLLFDFRDVRLGDKIVKMRAIEAVRRKQLDLALKGDPRAIRDLIARAEKQDDRLSRIPISVKDMSEKELQLLKSNLLEEQRAALNNNE